MKAALALLVAGALCLAYGYARAAERDVDELQVWAIVVCPGVSAPRGPGCGMLVDLPLQTRANCRRHAAWLQANVMKPGHTAQCLADLDELRAMRGW